MDKNWQQIKKRLQEFLPKGQYNLWVSTVDFLGLEGERLVLGCRNRFHIEWLREKLEKRLLTEVRPYFPEVRKLYYRIVSDQPTSKEEQASEGPQQLSFRELIKRPKASFNPRFTFDRFVVGNCNQFAYAATMAIANSQQMYNQSIYLLSETGLGKSHLSHAIGNYLYAQKPDLRVQYVTTEQFANEMIFALRNGTIQSFKDKFRMGCDVLLLEKIEFLSGKEKVQNELVYTLDELMDRGKRILCTGNAYPKDIPKLSTELQSRLGGILVAPIDPPDFKTRIEIIKRKAQSENIRIPTEVAEYLAEQARGDIRQLESCLVGMIAKTNILGVPITLQLAQDVTQTMLDRLPRITIEHVQQVVCESFQISVEALQSASRRKEIAMARKIGMYLCRQYTTESLVSIGKSFKRSHSSVLYAVKGLNKEMETTSGKLKRKVEYVSSLLDKSCLSM
jgi:chromosomal replication initiator protein